MGNWGYNPYNGVITLLITGRGPYYSIRSWIDMFILHVQRDWQACFDSMNLLCAPSIDDIDVNFQKCHAFLNLVGV